MRLEIEPRTLRLREPLPTAFGVLERRELLIVRLRAADGVMGVGEAAPLEPYDGVSLDAVREELESCRELLAGDGEHEALLDACRERGCRPQSLAALDLALWDLAGRRARQPVAALLAEHPAAEVDVNAVIGAVERGAAAARAATAVANGMRCVKVKVGVDGDAGRVAAVRAAGGRTLAIRLDANGAWTVEQAVASLRGLGLAGIELCEEPVHGIEAIRAVREGLEGRVAVAMDETAVERGALESGAADAVCLKIAACGGIGGVMRSAALARAAGSEVYLASTFDGPAGIAAGLHAAAALRVTRPCGLATLDLFADCPDPFPVRHGTIAVPSGPGLGVP